jgi:hypothetical protein
MLVLERAMGRTKKVTLSPVAVRIVRGAAGLFMRG